MQDRIQGSPADLAEEILRESPYHAIRKLKCRYRNGVLIVAGQVSTFFLKQLAQSAVRKVDGVREIDDRIEVVE